MRDALYAFMAERPFCVMSTVSTDGKPESAMVGFSHTKTFDVVIGTSSKSRKYANLLQNSKVSITIGDGGGTVQLDGTAEVLTHDAYTSMIDRAEITALPGVDTYRQDPNQVFVKTGEGGGKEEFTEF